VTNVFQNSQLQNTKVSITDPEIKIEKQSKDIDEEILDIFSK
jgi:hypothetical protein